MKTSISSFMLVLRSRYRAVLFLKDARPDVKLELVLNLNVICGEDTGAVKENPCIES